MPVPSDITALSTTAASNSPPGSETPSSIDDYLRSHASFIAQIRAVIGGTTDANIPVSLFGIGASVVPNIGNMDAFTQPTGIYKFANGVDTGTLPSGATNGIVHIDGFTSAIRRQTFLAVNGASDVYGVYVRQGRSGTTWGAWAEVYSAASTRLGYGVTPSAWTSTLNTIDSGWGAIAFGTTAGTVTLAANYYSDGVGSKYKNTGVAYVLNVGVFGTALSVARAPSGTAGTAATLAGLFAVDDNGNATVQVPTGGIGYSAGAGGTATQATNKATTVTLNKPCGQITMHNAALAASTRIGFNLSNSVIQATDTVIAVAQSSGNYRVEVAQVAAGLAVIYVTNMTGGSLSDALVINFTVIRGVAS